MSQIKTGNANTFSVLAIGKMDTVMSINVNSQLS